jgi:hypothetical protein
MTNIQLDIHGILKAAKAVGVQHYFIENENPDYDPTDTGYYCLYEEFEEVSR